MSGIDCKRTLGPQNDRDKPVTKQEVAPREGDIRFVQLERELRANEDRWDAVLANPFMGITVLDKNQYFITTNSTFQAMVGYTEDELKKSPL